MEPSGIIFTERREQPIKQWPFPDKKVGATTKAKRHPQTRRFMFMREDHDGATCTTVRSIPTAWRPRTGPG